MSNCLWRKHKTEPNVPVLNKCLHQSHKHFCAPFLSQGAPDFSRCPVMVLEQAGWRGARSPPQKHTRAHVQNVPQPREDTVPQWASVLLGSGRTWISSALCLVSPIFWEITVDIVQKRVQEPLCARTQQVRDRNYKPSSSATPKLLQLWGYA